MINPLISIVTVCLNSGQTVERTIKSVLSQKTAQVEYIVIDGGSTDDTVDIIKSYRKGIDKWISEPDNGIYDAMNKGILYSSGEYLFFLNSDDCLRDGAIRTAIRYITALKPDVLYSDVYFVGEGVKHLWKPFPLEHLYWEMAFSHQGSYVRYTENLRFDSRYRVAADYDMMLELYYENKRFSYMPFATVDFMVGGMSFSREYEGYLEAAEIAIRRMRQHQPGAIIYKEQIVDKLVREELRHQIDSREYDTEVLSSIRNYIGDSTRLIVFGAGIVANRVLPMVIDSLSNISYVVDNDEKKQGGVICEIPIYAPNIIENETNSVEIIILCEKDIDIYNQMVSMRLNQIKRIIRYKELLKVIEDACLEICSKKVPDLGQIL